MVNVHRINPSGPQFPNPTAGGNAGKRKSMFSQKALTPDMVSTALDLMEKIASDTMASSEGGKRGLNKSNSAKNTPMAGADDALVVACDATRKAHRIATRGAGFSREYTSGAHSTPEQRDKYNAERRAKTEAARLAAENRAKLKQYCADAGIIRGTDRRIMG
jgi:hypothetical protein